MAQGLDERVIAIEGNSNQIQDVCKLMLEKVDGVFWVQRPRGEQMFSAGNDTLN